MRRTTLAISDRADLRHDTFLKAHWDTLAAVDVTTTEVWTLKGLVTLYVPIVIELKSRRIEIADVSASPDSAWMAQATRHLTNPENGFLKDTTHVITNRLYEPFACNHGTRHRDTSALLSRHPTAVTTERTE